MSSASRRVLQVSARAFVSPPSSSGGSGAASRGGNPVTIFVPSSSIIDHHHDHPSSSLTPLTPEYRARLAQTCQWESVIIEPSIVYDQSSAEVVPQFSFYMPSGEEISFCAHAAIGACSFLANKAYIIKSGTNNESSMQQQQQQQSCNDYREENDLVITFIAAQEEHKKYHANVRGSEAELVMDCEHYESKCNRVVERSNSSTLSDFLKEIGLHENDIDSDAISTTFINSSVARPKTLIPLKSAHRVHAATPPKDATKFQEMCESIGSTGLYLYDSAASVAKNDDVIECRQFPKASGYAEDPATGIGAGALVASLYRQQLKSNLHGTKEIGGKVTDGGNVTTIFQGTAMARPSQIKVKIDKYDDVATSSSTVNKDPSYCGNVRISYAGLVAFDSVSYIE